MKTALAVIRTHCNYSQMTLALVLGLSRQVVSAWENGKKKIPEGRLAELALLFGVPVTLLTTKELDVVERWCDRPVFPTEACGAADERSEHRRTRYHNFRADTAAL